MVVHVSTVAFSGIETTPVDVQVHIAGGDPTMTVVGLPSGAVRESKERIRSAFHAMGLRLPAKRITINLSPADIAKDGSHYDLPIAVGLLVALGIMPQDSVEQALFLGELSLDGTLSSISGALPAAIQAVSYGLHSVYVPAQNAQEAAWAQNINVYGPQTLKEIIQHMTGETRLSPLSATLQPENREISSLDMSDVRGQETAKRAIEIAAAGGHNILLSGAPGSGKSMLAARMVGILPPLSSQEALEVSMVHSVAGVLKNSGKNGLVTQRPFRDPHHSASSVALTGGGLKAQPGEMSLSHRGVLFMDELPEFPRQVLETLRQPLETGSITISRANKHVTYPARFQLVAAMNPCPCGYYGVSADTGVQCKCRAGASEKYLARLSGPLLDRFDIQLSVPPVSAIDMSLPPAKEGTQEIAARVLKARQAQQRRFQQYQQKLTCNAELSGKMLDDVCRLPEDAQQLMTKASEKYGLSARGYHRVLKVARTIADIEAEEHIQRSHIAEALSYRGIAA